MLLFADFALILQHNQTNLMMKKFILLLLMVTVVCGCGNKQAAEKDKSKEQKAPTRVSTEVVSARAGIDGQSYVGIVEESEGTAVSFTGMGVVRRMLVREGQAVGRGQLIAVMDDTQARNMLSSAEAQMTQANDALKRYGMLHDNGSLPEVQWVEIQSKVTQAKAQLEVARKNLRDCRLVAPVSGVIGRRLVGAGETAMPSQAVVTILDVSRVKVRVAIPEAEVGSISANTSSIIQVDAINSSFVGGRIEKGVQADALTHTYDIRISVANHGRKLLPGMVANVQFRMPLSHQTHPQPLPKGGESDMTNVQTGNQNPSLGEGQRVGYTLPVTAVQKKADGSLFVWMINKDNTAHRTPVTIGETQGNRVTVTSGVGENQRIVTEGYQKLSEGTKVVY